MTSFFVRPERAADVDAVRAVHIAAFGQPDEARIVDDLRAAGALSLALVAESVDVTSGAIPRLEVAVVDGVEVVDAAAGVPSLLVGHIAFSPVTVDGNDVGAVGLAPIGVRPAWQRRGVGRALVDAGLAELRLRQPAVPFVVVVGHASYYPRHFGFVPGARFGLRWEGGHDESFFVLPLGAPERVPGGVVRYRPEVA